jgi:hypothetical protein
MAKLPEQFKEFLGRDSVGEVLDKEGSVELVCLSVTRAPPHIAQDRASQPMTYRLISGASLELRLIAWRGGRRLTVNR